MTDKPKHEEDTTTEIPEKLQKWETLKLKPKLIESIYKKGFEKPSFIQKEAIPKIIAGEDLLAQAQSGTGKTGAFVIGSLQRIDESLHKPQCLVLASTREIAQQNANLYKEIGAGINVTACLLSGGTSSETDRLSLGKGPQVVVGTPGRVKHMIEYGYFDTKHVKIFILDEADEMLKEDFEVQVREIYGYLALEGLQRLFFSATFKPEELEFAKKIVKNPHIIDLRLEEQTLQGIRQVFVDIGELPGGGVSREPRPFEIEMKVKTMIDVVKDQAISQMIVFIKSKKAAAQVSQLLNSSGYPCQLISAELDQAARNDAMKNFKEGKTRILVSSSLCNRGIDVQALSVVVCLDLPDDESDYIHRVGRSGRYGRKGTALHILTHREVDALQAISKHFQSSVQPLHVGFNFQE